MDRTPERSQASVGASPTLRLAIDALVGLCLAAFITACSTTSNTTAPNTTASIATGTAAGAGGCPGTSKVNVVVAENFWGSIASQLGGPYTTVASIVTNPQTDPHDYEATPSDSRAIASAQYVIENGIGYDPWVDQLADANPNPDRKLLDIGSMLGLEEGDNPHRWYFPDDVDRVIDQITADYKAIDPEDAACFDQLNREYRTTGLARYKGLIDQIKARYAGTPVGASESIFIGLAEATGLDLITPEGYMDAISEGNDPTAQDKATVDAQIDDNQIKVFVFNEQNSTPDVQTLVDQAKAKGIPVSTVTETLVPQDASFQDWQSGQLQALMDALGGQSSS